ncbi:hypothetical protein O6H91_10G042400 [Diphasiastrum complanatum]|uniref:Uncharacterized protein n=1 Tax=Diphasiastrum complanatum TaxID=34168 RepID=A0ACC2CGB9_DIPCM|nr:hypothetical protein O6H91_10G042400 [Diphasiastrum complanatum]
MIHHHSIIYVTKLRKISTLSCEDSERTQRSSTSWEVSPSVGYILSFIIIKLKGPVRASRGLTYQRVRKVIFKNRVLLCISNMECCIKTNRSRLKSRNVDMK